MPSQDVKPSMLILPERGELGDSFVRETHTCHSMVASIQVFLTFLALSSGKVYHKDRNPRPLAFEWRKKIEGKNLERRKFVATNLEIFTTQLIMFCVL